MPRKAKKVKGYTRAAYMLMCKELKNLIPNRRIKSCTLRWKKKLDP